MCGRGGQIKSWCSCEPTRKTNKGEVGLEVSVTPSDMSLRCNVGKKTHREMLRIKRSVSAGYRQAHFIRLHNTTQKDELVDVEEAKH
ncbi:hypothetical protein YC2023_086987 [Brassica napus]